MSSDLSVVNPVVRQALADARHALRELYGDRLLHVILYGSQARGEATEDSDVDVLVVLRGEFRPSPEISRMSEVTVDLLAKYGKFLALSPMPERKYYQATPLLMNVREDGIAVL